MPKPVVPAGYGAPPPDVPLLLEFEEGPPASLGPGLDLDNVLGPPQDEELPSELRALLDEVEEPPTLVVEEIEPSDDQTMEDDVAEADFYLSQGMVEEARTVLRRMQDRGPGHPTVATLTERISRAAEAPGIPQPTVPVISVPDQPILPTSLEGPAPPAAELAVPEKLVPSLQEMAPKFSVARVPAESVQGGFVNLGAELEEELSAEEQLGATPGGPVVDGLLKEFKKGVREQLDEKDYETHYNLGIAYKEMELYDEAIQEFRLTGREPKRALECAGLLGLCYLAKGQPQKAIQDLEAALKIGGHPPEAYHSLRYDLGTAHEAIGDLERALEQFELLQSEAAGFRDVQARVQALRGRLPQAQEPKLADDTPTRKRKRISFI